MSQPLVLAIDQGSTNTKALLVGESGEIVAQASRRTATRYPRPGWVEQSARDIWSSVRMAICDVVAPDQDIRAIAISNQRESVVVWDAKTGEPVGPCITWQCRRTAERCEALRDAGHEALVEERTGLHINPLFPATKIAWLLDSGEGLRQRARAGELRAGTVDSWLLWNLTAGRRHATDASNASRTLLFRTDTLGWDETLCELFEVPSRMLPDVCASDHAYGKTSLSIGALRKGVPVHAMLGDSHAALFGHGVRRPGFVKATFGTGTSLMALTDRRRKSSHGLSGTIAWKTGDDVAYALEGNISVSAQAIDFIARLLGLEGPQALLELAQSVPTSNGIVFVPALVGLGAPYWSDTARGAIWVFPWIRSPRMSLARRWKRSPSRFTTCSGRWKGTSIRSFPAFLPMEAQRKATF